jgi:hypothetical protein
MHQELIQTKIWGNESRMRIPWSENRSGGGFPQPSIVKSSGRKKIFRSQSNCMLPACALGHAKKGDLNG